MAAWLGDQVADLVGERDARRFVRTKRLERGVAGSLLVLLPVAAGLAIWPRHAALQWAAIAAAATMLCVFAAYVISAVAFQRSVASRFGYSTRWAARHVSLEPAHLVEFLNDEIVAGGGTTPASVAAHLDAELAAEAVSGVDAHGNSVLLQAIGCVSELRDIPSPLTITGAASSCTVEDGRVAVFSYFATDADSAAWLHDELVARRRPRPIGPA